MTNREKAICEVYTGVCFCAGEKRKHVYEYASELLGRPVFTHEFYTLAAELKERAREDFVAICQDRYQEPENRQEPKQEPDARRICQTCRHRYEGVQDDCAYCTNLDCWEAAP